MIFGRGASGVAHPDMNDSERRHADQIKFGVVAEADYATAKVRVKIGDEDDEEGHLVTGWLPMAGGRARGDSDWHPLEVGERVMVLSESGELQNGMVLPAGLYSDDDPAPGDKAGLWRKKFGDDGKIEYDRDTGEFMVEAIAKATIKVGDTIAEVSDGKVLLEIAGTSVEVTDGTIKLSAGGVSLEISSGGFVFTGGSVEHDGKNIGKDHKHLGVTAGGGVSGIPE